MELDREVTDVDVADRCRPPQATFEVVGSTPQKKLCRKYRDAGYPENFCVKHVE